MGFVGFLRSGEMMAPESGEFDPGQHLPFNGIKVVNPTSPRAVVIHIKQSKTDPLRQWVSIYLRRMESLLCSIASLLSYLVVRGKHGGPQFHFRDRRALTCLLLVAALRKAISSASFKPEDYAGHSFRIGVATMVAA